MNISQHLSKHWAALGGVKPRVAGSPHRQEPGPGVCGEGEEAEQGRGLIGRSSRSCLVWEAAVSGSSFASFSLRLQGIDVAWILVCLPDSRHQRHPRVLTLLFSYCDGLSLSRPCPCLFLPLLQQ